jgi:2,3-bisphosphoglycerate-independent phosphoglycerate mutase
LKTKYAIIIPDGAADEPLEIFDGKTVLEAANIPNMDAIATTGRQGLVETIPEGFAAGSDVAQMTLLGYDPNRYYSGRAPIEAAANNLPISKDDWIFRCNLVTFADKLMADHSAGQISTDEAARLLDELRELFADDKNLTFYTGVSYRHLLVISNEKFKVDTVPPHDIIGDKLSKNMPTGKNAKRLTAIMQKTQDFFADHEVNKVRADLGENPVSSVWLWGQGQKAIMESFEKRFGVSGAAITAVDLVRGLAKLIGFDLIEVEGATGLVDTNYKGKADAAIKALETHDLVFIHIEGPDEAGHAGNAADKKRAVEKIDKHIVGPVHEALKKYDQYRILVMPDHPTPLDTQAHSDQPVPFAMAGTGIKPIHQKPYSEENANQSGFRIDKGCELMEHFLKIQ